MDVLQRFGDFADAAEGFLDRHAPVLPLLELLVKRVAIEVVFGETIGGVIDPLPRRGIGDRLGKQRLSGRWLALGPGERDVVEAQPLRILLAPDDAFGQKSDGILDLADVNLAERAPCDGRSEEHTSELQSLRHLVCRLLLEKKKT